MADLPAGLLNAGELTLQGQLPETDTTEREHAQIGAGPPAEVAAVAVATRKLGLLLEGLLVQRLSRQRLLL